MKYYLAILLAVASLGANAALIKWVDKEGRVHYSDSPPPAGVQSETLHSTDSSAAQDNAAASGVAAQPSVYQQAADIDKQRKEQAEADKKAADKARREEQEQQACDNARANLNTLMNSPRISNYDAQGNKVYLDEAARRQQEDQAQSQIEKYCK